MPASPSEPASLMFLLQRALRHFWIWAAAVILVGLLITVFLAKRTNQHYQSETIILIQQYPGAPDPRQAGGRLMDMLMTGERLGKLVTELNLFPELPSLQARIDKMRSRVVFKIHQGSTVSIAVVAEQPEPAQKATQSLAEGLMRDDERLRTLEAQRNRVFLQGERGRLETEVKRRENELQTFLREHPEVAMQPEIEVVTSGGDDGARALEQELERLRQAQERALSAGGVAEANPELQEARRRAETEVARSRQELSEKRDLLTDAHPDVIVAQQKLARAEDAYKRASAAEASSRRALMAASGAPGGAGNTISKQIEMLEQKLASSRSAGRGNAARGRRTKQLVAPLQVQYQSLRHLLDDARDRFSRLEEQQFQAEMLEKMQTDEGVGMLTVLDPAFLPAAPESNRRVRVALIGFVLSLVLGVLAAWLRALFSDVIYDRRDMEWLAGISVLAEIPRETLQRA